MALAGRNDRGQGLSKKCAAGIALTATGSDRSPTVNSASTMRLSRPIFTGRARRGLDQLAGVRRDDRVAAIPGTAGSLQTVEAEA